MNRFALIGVATAVLAASAPAFAQADAEAERAFARAARSFNACLASAAATDGGAAALESQCLAQETVYRSDSVRLHVARGLSEAQAASETESDIANGRRIFGAAHVQQLASAR